MLSLVVLSVDMLCVVALSVVRLKDAFLLLFRVSCCYCCVLLCMCVVMLSVLSIFLDPVL